MLILNKNNHYNTKLITGLLLSIFLSQNSIDVEAKNNVKITPSLSVGIGYSDNLEQDNTNKKNSAIAEISPALKVSKQGARVKLDVDYLLNSFSYSNKNLTESNNIDHNLKSKLQAELLEKSLFLNVDATITQELLDKTQNNNVNSVTGINNLTQTYSFSINPYWQYKIGPYATSILSYSHNQLIYSQDSNAAITNQSNDSEQNSISARINSGKRYKRLTWGITTSHSETKFDQTLQVSKSSSANANIAYKMNKEVSLITNLGYEKFNQDIDDTDNDTQDDNGLYSKIGFKWEPSPKNSLAANLGKRFYGNTYDAEYKHIGDRIKITLGYNEDITSARDQLRANNINSQNDLFEQTTLDDNPTQVAITPDQFSSVNQAVDSLYISKKSNLDITYQLRNYNYNLNLYQEKKIISGLSQREESYGGKISTNIRRKKSTYALSFNYEKRASSLNTQDGIDYGVDASWKLAIGKRMDSTTSIKWTKQKSNQSVTKKETRDLEIAWKLNRKLTRKLTAELSLKHLSKSSTINTEKFEENIAFLNLSQKF